MKIAVTTLYTPEISDFSKEAAKNFGIYCNLHGYDLFVYEETLINGLRGNWCKPKVLLNHIKEYDYIVWLDSDIAILDFDKKLEDIISPHKDKSFIATDDMGGWHLNNGFMIFKNTEYVYNFLSLLWEEQSKFKNKSRGDQAFFIDFIKKNNLPRDQYHLYSQAELCSPLLLKNEKTFSAHLMGIHINDVRKKYIKHINDKTQKNKNVIYVVNAYDNYKMPEIWRYSQPTLKNYCQKHGIDLIVCKPKDLDFYINRAYFKIDVVDEFIDSEYDNALILDNDIVVSNFAPNIFDSFTNGVQALDLSSTHKGMFDYFNGEFHNKFYPNLPKPSFMINSGAVLLDKASARSISKTKQSLKNPEHTSGIKLFNRDNTFCWEQNYFTYLINESDIKFNCMDYKYNFLSSYLKSMEIREWNPKNNSFYFLHIFGNNKDIGLRCLSEYRDCFNGIPEPPAIILPRDKVKIAKKKFDEFLKLKDEWYKLKDYDFIKYLSTQIKNPKPSTKNYSCHNPNQKIGIVSLYTPEISDYAIYSEENIRSYCRKNNYTFHVYRQSLDKKSHPNWSKAQALSNHINDHDYLIWMDSDTLIFNPEKKFEDIISKCSRKFIIATKDIGEQSMLNSGVLIFKSHNYTQNLIEKWRDFAGDKSSLYSSGGDQEILCKILKKSDPFGFNRKIFEMNEFNTDPRLVNKDTFILHFMAYPYQLKKIFMSYWQNNFLTEPL